MAQKMQIRHQQAPKGTMFWYKVHYMGRKFLLDFRYVLDSEVREVMRSPLMTGWIDKLDEKIQLLSMEVQSFDKFGPRVAFIKCKVRVVDPQGHFSDQVLFLRGDAVSVLPILICEGREYVAMVRQMRVAVGSVGWLEIPAGMLDGSNQIAVKALDELHEELGIKFAQKDLKRLIEQPVALSGGACDEMMHFFYTRMDVTRAQLEEIHDRRTGLADENEYLRVEVVPIDELVTSADAKTLLAYTYYRMKYPKE
jgi:ADP-sugar diphosphatase